MMNKKRVKPVNSTSRAAGDGRTTVKKDPPKINGEPAISETKDAKDEEVEESPEEKQIKFDRELKWCLQSLEKCFIDEPTSSSKPSTSSAGIRLKEANRVYNLLRNSKTSVIRKRQLMSGYFGDYRSKMSKEQAKFKSNASNSKISNILSGQLKEDQQTKRGVFIKKRIAKTDTDSNSAQASASPFNFSFNVETQDVMQGKEFVAN